MPKNSSGRTEKTLAVINSSCLDRLKRPQRHQLLEMIRRLLHAEILITTREEDLCRVAKESVEFKNIISCGGDGTFFNIINAFGTEGRVFGIIPLGTGNSLAHDLGIKDFRDAIYKISRARMRDIDLMEAHFRQDSKNVRRFAISTASVGFFAQVARAANLHYKKLGRLCYPVVTLLNSFNRPRHLCRISFEGSEYRSIEFTNLLVNNTVHIGHMRVFKNADIQDSRLNAWFCRMGFIEQLIWDLAVITGTYFYYPGEKRVLKRMDISLDNPAPISLDGEVFDAVKEMSLVMSDKKLNVFY